jgi:protein SCO1
MRTTHLRRPDHRGRILLAGMTALATLAIAGCDPVRGDTGHADVPQDETVRHAAQRGQAGEHLGDRVDAATELSGHSIYHLDSEWWDQAGDVRQLASLAGRVQVVAMVYTHCAHTCPRILMDMKHIEASLEQDGLEGFGFVLVSVDPERDTPGRLRAFAESTRLHADRWTLVSGSDDAVLELAMMLGVRIRRESATDFSHSNAMLVLDAGGEIVYRQDRLGADLGPMLDAVRASLPEQPIRPG